MITNINNASAKVVQTNSESSTKSRGKEGVKAQGDTSKIEMIKASIEKGEYAINLEALSKKIADELL